MGPQKAWVWGSPVRLGGAHHVSACQPGAHVTPEPTAAPAGPNAAPFTCTEKPGEPPSWTRHHLPGPELPGRWGGQQDPAGLEPASVSGQGQDLGARLVPRAVGGLGYASLSCGALVAGVGGR